MPSVSSALITSWNNSRQERERDRTSNTSKPEHDTEPEKER